MSCLGNCGTLFKYDEINLKNGLKVVSIPMDNNSKVINVNIFYKVGSRNEILGKSGVAHMLEHMSFKSTKNLQAGEFDNIVKKFGGQSNASTGFDYTNYFIRTNNNNLDKSLSLFSEMMQNLLLKDDEFQTERNVVSEERLWRTDNSPIGYLYFRLFNMAYLYHPYHWTPIGFMGDIKSWSIEDIKKSYDTYYQPKNAIIVVAGDIKSNEVFKLAKKHFGKIKNKSEIPQVHMIEPKQEDKRFAEIKKEGQEVELYALAYKIPNYENKDQIALSVLSYILTGGKSSILVDNLVNKEKLARSIQAFNMDLKDEGLFIIIASGNKNVKAKDMETSILKHLKNIKNGDISEDDLKRAKINIKAEFIYSLQDSSQVSNLYGDYFAKGNIKPLLDYENNFEKLKKSDIINVANKYFIDEKSNTIFLK